ncbi:3'(2'), 5'-bisphosphate nucleotidase [Geosmithia morbida]|uniref:3'(2'), 5'-bisphosphate nucleotidase n=1 Tax=Geosmithia morbida TaxID=1094350 RepID=A0A9P4YQ43_9HYPO|nr:3'(2'), 5'-bisphosphate nucleotidase [Geosmithia morbida]KAF4119561.1 3'(2'), 5'-bisphosphate nucleotidase [Geosmithia morbida]
MASPYQRELDVAMAAVRVAARMSEHVIGNKDKGVIQKDDLSPVTVADFAIQAFLASTIKTAFPGDRVVGEEDASQMRTDLLLLEGVYSILRWAAGHGDSDEATAAREAFPGDCRIPEGRENICDIIDECGSTKPAATGRTWVFDPIDGTKTFVEGGLYAINVALLVDGKQTLSVVGCPNLSVDAKAPLGNSDVSPSGSIYSAIKGHGARVQPLDGSSEPRTLKIQPDGLGLSDTRFVSCTTLTDSALDGIHDAVARRIDVPFPTCDLLPWVVRWVAVAAGLGNTIVWVYKRRDRLGKIWDHAGAMLLFEETGGHITDVLGKPIDLVAGRKMVENYGFVAAPQGLHKKVLQTVQDVLKEQGHEALLA